MSDQIRTTVEDGVLSIRLHRPQRKNALTAGMYAALADALGEAATGRDVKVAVFLGSDGVFTSGNDINDFLNDPPHDPSAPVHRFLSQLATTDLPLVAAVDGPAVGIGTTMLFHCDFVYVTERARLQMPFVDLALVPEAGSSYLAPRLLGHARAAELLMLSEAVDGAAAVRLGIANRVCAPDALEAEAFATARRLAAKPPAALRATKALLRHSEDRVGAAMRREGEAFASRLGSSEAKEAFSAFLEKRPADFSRCT